MQVSYFGNPVELANIEAKESFLQDGKLVTIDISTLSQSSSLVRFLKRKINHEKCFNLFFVCRQFHLTSNFTLI